MAQAASLTIHTDGASRGNPGPSAFAFVIARDGHPPLEQAGRLPNTTNNQAEYTAILRALKQALELGVENRVVLHSDSELIVKQMKGEYRVKDAGLRPLYEEADSLRKRFTHPVRFVHVRREANRRADELCNMVLDGDLPANPVAVPPVPPSPKIGKADTVHQQAIALLAWAAEDWRRGKPSDLTPEVLWQRLWTLVQQHGVWVPKGRSAFSDEEE